MKKTTEAIGSILKTMLVGSALFLSGCGGGGGASGGAGGGGGSVTTTTLPGGGAAGPVAVTNGKSFSGSNIDTPIALAVDAAGNVWVANFNTTGITKIQPSVATSDCSAGCPSFSVGQGVTNTNYLDIAIDKSGNTWVPFGASAYKISGAGAVSQVNMPNGSNIGGDYLAVDSSNNIWLSGGFTSASVSKVSNSGAPLTPANFLLTGARGISIDADGNAWVISLLSNNTGHVVKLPVGSPTSPVTFSGGGLLSPGALAIDNSGNVWAVNANLGSGTGNSTVTAIGKSAPSDCSTGCVNYSGAILNAAEGGPAVDGANNIWVAGGIKGNIIKIEQTATADCSTGCTSYTSPLLSHPWTLAIDGAGNVWIGDTGTNSIVEFPALAAATVTPTVARIVGSGGGGGGTAGVNWTPRASGSLNTLNGVACSTSLCVAVGITGTILTSPTGLAWTAAASGNANILSAVTWTGTQFIAVGAGGTILTSPDGATWTLRASGTTNALKGIACSTTQCAAVGASIILTSPNGVNWTSRPLTTGAVNLNLNAITWSGTEFVAAGGNVSFVNSPDGVTWTPNLIGSITTNDLFGITWTGTQFVAVGGNSTALGYIATSADAVSWSPKTSGATKGFFGVASSGTQLLAVGYISSGASNIFSSTDGITWTAQTSGLANPLFGIAWSGSRFVAVGGAGDIVTSP